MIVRIDNKYYDFDDEAREEAWVKADFVNAGSGRTFVKPDNDNDRFRLSKSRYCSGVQCPKILWLKKNKPEVFDDSVFNQAILDTGNEVGDLAMGLFGDYTEVPFNNDLTKMLYDTEELLKKGVKVIAEASFSYKGLFCSVDILKNLGDDHVKIYEVKSATSVHDPNQHDVAFQNYVLKQLGFKVDGVYIVHLNNQYIRHGDLDIQQLFTIEDMTETADSLFFNVEMTISELRTYLEKTEEPAKPISMSCLKPYECGFWKYCTDYLPKPNAFDLVGVHKEKMFKCIEDGKESFKELLSEGEVIKEKAVQQILHEINDLPPEIDKGAIKKFLVQLKYPLYFLDFETFNPAIPMYDNTKPYEQICFQYSLHYIEQEGGELKHKEFLAYPGKDPRRELAERLCEDIPVGVCTLAYNMGFEKTVINKLACLYPDLSAHLMDIHTNIKDLMVPFRDRKYYCRLMKGYYSIKYVLPALFPDDPALDYHNLEGVHNGSEASATFLRMDKMSSEELEAFRGHLLKYCGLDTYAMVKVWQKLNEVSD